MNRKTLHLMLMLFTLSLTTGCNSGIFVDELDLPPYTTITVEPDGGEWSTTFSRKGLKEITILSGVKNDNYLTYLDVDGDVIDERDDASRLGAIVYEDPAQYYSVGISGNILTFQSHYNAMYDHTVVVALTYEWGAERQIIVEIPQGQRLVTDITRYDGEMRVQDDFEVIPHHYRFVNNSSLTQTVEVMPYLSTQASDKSLAHVDWARYLEVEMTMIAYDGDDWIYRPSTGIILDGSRSFSPGDYSRRKFTVEVPANSSAVINYSIHYSLAMQDGTLVLDNKVAGSKIEVPFTCTVIYPTACSYHVDYE